MAGGRPTKLTSELQEKLCKVIADGNYYRASCAVVGLNYTTFRKWLVAGRKQKRGQFRQFFDAVRKAEADAETRVVSLWQEQIPGNWQAARDFLARRNPRDWMPKESHEVTGKGGNPIKVVGGIDLDAVTGRKPGLEHEDQDAPPETTP